MKLSKAKRLMIRNAATGCSRDALKDIFYENISKNIKGDLWLSLKNRYSKETIRRLEDDVSCNRKFRRDIKEYIAASSLLHCSDGWDYLSVALECLIDGKYGQAIHLAYYSELRAAMSFLASHGIGVFNNRHVHINSKGKVIYTNNSNINTHKYTWEVFKNWANVKSNSDSILEIFNIGGISLYEWINADQQILSHNIGSALAKKWLTTWSLDLDVTIEDQYLRNEVSYRPREMSVVREYDYDLEKELRFIIHKWKLCEPVSSIKFRLLDYHLLREIFEQGYRSNRGVFPNKGDIDEMYDRIIGNLGISKDLYLRKFLSRRIEPKKCQMLKDAKLKQKDTKNQYRPISVLARSFLLLRLSLAAVNDTLEYCNINESDIKFWLYSKGINKGIFENTTSIPSDMNDLWLDIENSIDQIEHWSNSNTPNRMKLIQSYSLEKIMLTQTNRSFFWGIT